MRGTKIKEENWCPEQNKFSTDSWIIRRLCPITFWLRFVYLLSIVPQLHFYNSYNSSAAE